MCRDSWNEASPDTLDAVFAGLPATDDGAVFGSTAMALKLGLTLLIKRATR
jgi:hypothetical protein